MTSRSTISTTTTVTSTTTSLIITTIMLNPVNTFINFFSSMMQLSQSQMGNGLTDLKNYIKLPDSSSLLLSGISLSYIILVDSNVPINFNQDGLKFLSAPEDNNQLLYSFDRTNQLVYSFDQGFYLLNADNVANYKISFMYINNGLMYAMTVKGNITCLYQYIFPEGLVGNSIIGNLNYACNYFFFDHLGNIILNCGKNLVIWSTLANQWIYNGENNGNPIQAAYNNLNQIVAAFDNNIAIFSFSIN